MSKVKDFNLASAHWEWFVPFLGDMYITGFVHGIKHGREGKK